MNELQKTKLKDPNLLIHNTIFTNDCQSLQHKFGLQSLLGEITKRIQVVKSDYKEKYK